MRLPLLVLCLVVASPALAQVHSLPRLEERHLQAKQDHHDVVVRADRLQGELRKLNARLLPLDREAQRLRAGEQGLLERSRLKAIKPRQIEITNVIVTAQAELRGLLEADEPTARLNLILARADLVRRLIEVASRPTRRSRSEDPADFIPNRHRADLLNRAGTLRVKLDQLERFQTAAPLAIHLVPANLSDTELRLLPAALAELRDGALAHRDRLDRVARVRARLVTQLERAHARFPQLAQGLLLERRALARVRNMQATLKTRAENYDKELGRIQTERVIRELRRLKRALRRLVRMRMGPRRG